MRLIFTLVLFLFSGITVNAQHLTGVWRGYFSSASSMFQDDPREELYKYEIQINQLPNNALQGVTYSYKTTIFYAKTGLQGIYTVQSKSLIIKETKIIEMKIGDGSAPCLMTCYLDYSKLGKLEVLQGTFISTSMKNKADCGSGKVYLEKVTHSDFKKEDFLARKPAPVLKKNPEIKKTVPPAVTRKTIPPPAKKNAGPPVLKQTTPAMPVPVLPERKPDTTIHFKKEPFIIKVPPPRVLRERENNLVRTIYTDEEDIQIDIYDNGTIDNDTISLYHNNKLVVSNARLSYTPITYKLKCNAVDYHHEFVIVAENLGEIPPNTALMVITVGKTKKRFEIFLASNESRNAKVVIEYRPGN